MNRIGPKLGVLVPLTDDALAPAGVGTYDSSYTAAGAGPGVAEGVTAWRPVVTGGQSSAVDLYAVRGGFPGRGGGATQVLARLASETDATDWRACAEPVLLTGFYGPSVVIPYTHTTFHVVARSDTGVLVLVGADGAGGAACYSFDPYTEIFTSGASFSAQGLATPIALAEDPGTPGRVILWSGEPALGEPDEAAVAYYSDDSGATWSPYCVGWNADSPAGIVAVATHPSGGEWLAITTAETFYYSADRGVSWYASGAAYAGDAYAGAVPTVARGPRGYVVAYPQVGTRYPAVRVLTTARSSWDGAGETILSTTNEYEKVVVIADYDGSLYAYGFQAAVTSPGQAGRVAVWRSDDGGYSWTGYTSYALGNTISSVDIVGLWAASGASSAGACWLFGTARSGTNAGNPLLARFGGWSNVDHGSVVTEAISRNYRFGWGAGITSPQEGAVWYSTAAPDDHQWTVTTAGTPTLSYAAGALVVALDAADRYTFDLTTSSANAVEYAAGEGTLQVVSGRGRTTAETHFAHTCMWSAGNAYDLRIYVGTDGFEVRDGSTTVRASVSADTTSAPRSFRWNVRADGTADVWTRLRGETKWTQSAAGVTLTSSVILVNRVRWQSDATTTTQTRLWMVAGLETGDWRYGLDDAGDYDLTPADGVRGIMASRPLAPAGGRTPLPLLGAAGDDAGYLHGLGGPILQGDTATIPVGYQWPVSSVSPAEAPSPAASWRATGTAEVALVYDASAASWRGGALALVAVRASWRTATLSVDDGAGGWTVLGTLDKGADVTYALAGTTVRPGGAAPGLARYVAEGELVGGYVVLPTSGADAGRRIVANSAGYWDPRPGVQAVRITVAGLDGTEDASGAGAIVWPSGVLVTYALDTSRRYLRIRIPSGQAVPADRGEDDATAAYDAGVLCAARVVGLGTEAEYGTTRAVALPAQVARRRDGAPTMSRTGPARRTWTYSWSPSSTGRMRLRDYATGYVESPAGGSPIGTDQDAWSALPAVVDALDGRPCVLVARLPAVSATLTDPSLWVYGLATAPDLTLSHGEGSWEGEDEIIAVGSLTVEELP